MPKLRGYKAHHFTSIKENINPLSDHNSVVLCTNVESHVKPGIFTLRPPYTLKYLALVDDLNRLDSPVPISFDNFYEKESTGGVEVTVQVQAAQIKAPSNVTGVSYAFNSPIIWMRPFYNGSYWEDRWQWLNETIITNLATAMGSTYKNQVDIQGYFGDLSQWSVVNVTRDTTLPMAILLSAQNSTNTTIWISAFNNNWQSGDVIVLMKNYIPIKYLAEMANVTQQEISFHRIPSKLRIGFGGKVNRIALGIEYVSGTIQMANYAYQAVAPRVVGHELNFANSKKMIVQPYTQINEDNKDFGLNILVAADTVDGFPAGTYYFRMTAVLDGTNEILVCETSIQSIVNQQFFPIPWIRPGSISRRLTSLKIYFGQNNTNTNSIDYYFFKEIDVRLDGNSITEKYWSLNNDGRLVYTQSPAITTNIYTEASAANPVSSTNVLGSWAYFDPVNDPSNMVVEVIGSSPYYISVRNIYAYALASMRVILPAMAIPSPTYTPLSQALISNATYKIIFTCKSAVPMIVTFNVQSLSDSSVTSQVSTINTTTADQTITLYVTMPDFSSVTDPIFLFTVEEIGGVFPTEHFDLRNFQVIQEQTNYLNVGTQLGSLDINQMGYTPTLNLVKDWACALVRKGSTFVASAFIDQLYSTLVFFSPISGDGNSQYDVLIAGKFLDADKDNFRGESIIAMAQLLNTLLLAITEAGGVIIDPDSGETQEVSRGFGIVTKESLRSYRGMLFWASTEDFVATDPSGYTAQAIDEDSVRQFLKSVPDNTKLSACIDKYGSYHVALGKESSVQELLFTKRGWFDQSRDYYPAVMRNGFMDIVWFMDSSGNIFWIPLSSSTPAHIAIDDAGKIATDDDGIGATDDAGGISAF